MLTCRSAQVAACLALFGAATGQNAAADASLSAKAPASSTNPLAVSCSATSAPSEAGTSDYYVVLKAQYQNRGSQTIVPIIIRFDFHDQSGKIVASHTVIDSTGLAPQYAKDGQWQLVGYPANAASLTCSRVSSSRL